MGRRVLRTHVDDHGLVCGGSLAGMVALGVGDYIFNAGIDHVGSG